MPWSESAPADTRLKSEAAEETARIANDPINDINPSSFGDAKE